MHALTEAELRLIMEIEETGLLPTKVCGKVLTSALSSHYIHPAHGNVPYPIQRATFVQILNGAALAERTRKPCQGGALEISIKAALTKLACGIDQYRLFFTTAASFSTDTVLQAELRALVCHVCGCAAALPAPVP